MSLKLDANWTDDCQGKKDYDGPILWLSTRYWPPDGGMLIFNTNEPEKLLHPPEMPEGGLPGYPCARSSLVIRGFDYDSNGRGIELADSGYIYGESFEEIAAKVEAWAQEQMDKAVAALKREFPAWSTT
jgi:hypothetical protein